jgi:hypothetical protein
MRVTSIRHRFDVASPYDDGVGPSISLEVTVDDLIAYNLYLLKTSPSSRTQMRRFQLWAVVPLLVAGAILGPEAIAHSAAAITGLVTCTALIGWIVLLPRYAAWQVPKRIRRLIANGLVPAPKPSRLWVDESGGVVDQSLDRTTSYGPTAITGIDVTPEHVFLTVGPGNALIIPRRIGEPAVQAFLQALAWHRAQRDASWTR